MFTVSFDPRACLHQHLLLPRRQAGLKSHLSNRRWRSDKVDMQVSHQGLVASGVELGSNRRSNALKCSSGVGIFMQSRGQGGECVCRDLNSLTTRCP